MLETILLIITFVASGLAIAFSLVTVYYTRRTKRLLKDLEVRRRGGA